jgi:hypothetical protein
MSLFCVQSSKDSIWPRRLCHLVALALLALLSAACASRTDVAQDRAVAAVERLGGRVVRDSALEGNPVVKADLSGTLVTDGDLAALQGLAQLHHVVLRKTAITDAGLPLLFSAGKLRNLELEHTSISDAGLSQIERLTSLRDLRLAGTHISDAGLAHLRPLTKLWVLDLGGTKISDAGLTNLRGLTALRSLDLSNTRVTEAAIFQLRRDLPRAQIAWRPLDRSVK